MNLKLEELKFYYSIKLLSMNKNLCYNEKILKIINNIDENKVLDKNFNDINFLIDLKINFHLSNQEFDNLMKFLNIKIKSVDIWNYINSSFEKNKIEIETNENQSENETNQNQNQNQNETEKVLYSRIKDLKSYIQLILSNKNIEQDETLFIKFSFDGCNFSNNKEFVICNL